MELSGDGNCLAAKPHHDIGIRAALARDRCESVLCSNTESKAFAIPGGTARRRAPARW